MSTSLRGIAVAEPQDIVGAQTERQVAHWTLAAARLDLDDLASPAAWSQMVILAFRSGVI